ncbi:unnamed protein product [Fusarium graminearum]|uniref:Chromosome 2, complete genome n=1 Tax=Gibberella zeae (strain ATCC MYA-4620 / CBS 123657 / FGSC 9075 / NRRL 31084 / PH-1) TaxID=229533 RepID=A0A098DH00_GIBZE|nr:unnamed protein product [Fusarium graminearum]CZS81499.1 unnamed protein product [Fusarium graminearum]
MTSYITSFCLTLVVLQTWRHPVDPGARYLASSFACLGKYQYGSWGTQTTSHGANEATNKIPVTSTRLATKLCVEQRTITQ